MTKHEAIKQLNELVPNGEHCCLFIWNEQSIKDMAADISVELTINQVHRVLNELQNSDISLGIDNDFVQHVIKEVIAK
jgi:hypothetical protein